jgi:HEAT repeat protein
MVAVTIDRPAVLDVAALGLPAPTLRVPALSGWRAAWSSDAPSPFAAGGTALFRRQAAEECLDVVGVLRAYRAPQPEEDWRTPRASERRLLAQVNAIAGLGPQALERIAALAIDPDLPDPGRVFAATFTLGCIGGPDWLPALQRIVKTAVARHPEEGAQAMEALSLSPREDLPSWLSPLLRDASPALRAAAVRVLGFRWQLDEAAWAQAMRDPHPDVVRAALLAPVHRFDPARVEPLLLTAAASTDEPTAQKALRLGAALRSPALHGQAARMAARDPGWAGALQALALHGHPGDATLLRGLLRQAHRWPAVRAAGALGLPALMPDLIALHDDPLRSDEERRLAAQALTTIAGPTPAGATSPADEWRRVAAEAPAERRLRGGRPLNAAVLLAQLSGPGWWRAGRQDLYLELIAASRVPIARFSPFDFVAVQEDALDRIAEGMAPGTARAAISAPALAPQ